MKNKLGLVSKNSTMDITLIYSLIGRSKAHPGAGEDLGEEHVEVEGEPVIGEEKVERNFKITVGKMNKRA